MLFSRLTLLDRQLIKFPDTSLPSCCPTSLQQQWSTSLPLTGFHFSVPPRSADQGREFISHEFEEWCSSRSILLHHIGAHCPWQNGIAESYSWSRLGENMQFDRCWWHAAWNRRSCGGVLFRHQWNGRQSTSGRRWTSAAGPRWCSCWSWQSVGTFIVENKPSLPRQVALREAARVAMVRMHFPRSLRRGELARARSTTLSDLPQPGDLCYFLQSPWQRYWRYKSPKVGLAAMVWAILGLQYLWP